MSIAKSKDLLTRTSNPHIEINCLLNDGHIAYGKSDLAINDLSFTGYYSNGSENHPETSHFQLKILKQRLGSAEYSGSFYLSAFDNPLLNSYLKGKYSRMS